MIVIGEALQLLSDFGIATDVRFGVKSEHFAKSLVYLVGACEERGRHGKADSFSGLEIKDQLNLEHSNQFSSEHCVSRVLECRRP
jgi:hypothetical protein